MSNIFQSAIDNWPEDEAVVVSEFWANPEVKQDYTPNEYKEKLLKDVRRMENFFKKEDDAEDLIRRFRSKLTKILVLPIDYFNE